MCTDKSIEAAVVLTDDEVSADDLANKEKDESDTENLSPTEVPLRRKKYNTVERR